MKEDIKILEEFIEAYRIAEGVLDGDVINAIENLIARYKELEKYKKYYETEKIIWSRKDYIPKSKVQEKIEELKKYGNNLTEEQRQKETEFLQGKLKAYEELLED